METKDNMKQAMYEMFGIGNDRKGSDASPAGQTLPNEESEKRTPAASVLAAGTRFVGKIYTEGDIDVFGTFEGDITAKGRVKIVSAHDGDITAGSVDIVNGETKGNITAVGTVSIGKGSRLCGNVSAKEVICSGELEGNLNISGSAMIEATARVIGDVSADTISIAKGAFVRGAMEIQASEAPKNIVAPIKPVEK